jgi:hypothetical protein
MCSVAARRRRVGARGVAQVSSLDKKSFLLRIDPVVWRELERLAGADLRSVNAEIEFLLREALERRGIRPKDAGKKQRG